MRLATRMFVLAAVFVAFGGTARAAAPTLGADGETAPVYDYLAATHERAFIPQPGIDQDRNGVADKVTVDILRPTTSERVPAIVVPSPYLTTLCLGRRNECLGDADADGVNDRWPLFLDNFFVPRGYAVVYAQMNGTGYTADGCPHHGGPGDITGEKSVIEWLNGRPWHNGASAMIGKSYDGTLANGVAATGVQGLKTIVPIAAISDWYDYSRTGGIRTSTTHYPRFLNQAITYATGVPGVSLPDRRPICAPVNTDFDALDGDATGDRNAFWDDRDYTKNVRNVKAAVFAVHGFQDDNVTMSQLWPWWNGLEAAGVPRKLWLLRSGHADPFDSRRAEWVDTLHRWFDHWLYGVDNGIMGEPRVTIEDAKDTWGQYADWPVPGTSEVGVFLRTTTQAEAGVLRGASGGPLDSVSFTGESTTGTSVENRAINDPTGSQANRRVFLSPPLARDVRLSGRAVLELRAALGTTQSNLGVELMDYGAGTQVTRSDEGIAPIAGSSTCWGTSSPYDSACYPEFSKPLQNVTQWRVTRGILDSSNRTSLSAAVPVISGQPYDFEVPTEPTEHTFAAGHRIGVVVTGNLIGTAGTPGAQITVDTKLSKVVLPIVGGDAAARASGLTDEGAPVTTATVSPAPNAAGWVHAKPTVTLGAGDGDGSGVVSLSYAVGAGAPVSGGDHVDVPVGAEGVTTIRYAASDRAGNAEVERTLTVRVDTIAPGVSCPMDARWHADNVAVVCTATDGGSGVTSSLMLRTAVAAGAETARATAERSVCDIAGNCAGARATRMIDRAAPTVALTVPPTTELARGAAVRVRHACTDGGSGVVACTGPDRLDTATAGAHELVVSARDEVGNARTERWRYWVLNRLPKTRVRAANGHRLALVSRLGATVRVTGALRAAGKRVRIRAIRVKLAPGVRRLVTIALPRGVNRATADLKLVTTAGALRRTDRATLRLGR